MRKRIKVKKDKAWRIHPEPSFLGKLEIFTIKLKQIMKKILLLILIGFTLGSCSTDSTITEVEQPPQAETPLLDEVLSMYQYTGSFTCDVGGNHTPVDYWSISESDGIYTLKMWKGYFDEDDISFCYEYTEQSGTQVTESNGYLYILGELIVSKWTHSNGFNYICATYGGGVGDACVSTAQTFNPNELTPCY